jgi:hypothetical protein
MDVAGVVEGLSEELVMTHDGVRGEVLARVSAAGGPVSVAELVVLLGRRHTEGKVRWALAGLAAEGLVTSARAYRLHRTDFAGSPRWVRHPVTVFAAAGARPGRAGN